MPPLPLNMVPIPGLFGPQPALLLGSGRETPAPLLFVHPPSETSDSNIQLLPDLNSLMPQALLILTSQIEVLIFPQILLIFSYRTNVLKLDILLPASLLNSPMCFYLQQRTYFSSR